MGDGQKWDFCDKMHCNCEITDGYHERLQLLCFNLQALALYDWMINIILLLLLLLPFPLSILLLSFHHYVFGFSFYCLVLQELLLFRVHCLVNLSIRILIIILKHYFSIGSILMQWYVGVVLSLVEIVEFNNKKRRKNQTQTKNWNQKQTAFSHFFL